MLPEGLEIELMTTAAAEDGEEWPPELDAELLRRFHEVEAGAGITAGEFLARLRARRTA